MWQKFTERARRCILLAQHEASHEQEQVDTQHLLLGILREECVAAEILNARGATLETIRPLVPPPASPDSPAAVSPFKKLLGHQQPSPPAYEPKLTAQSKRVLEYSADEARRMSHAYIGTEHVLLGLARHQDGAASHILRQLSLDLETLRALVRKHLGPAKEDDISSSEHPDDVENRVRLMLAFLRDENSAVVQILVECGLNLETARHKLQQQIKARPRAEAPVSPPTPEEPPVKPPPPIADPH